MASGLLPKSPVSSSLCDEVPHIFIPKSHLEPREFLISSAKRLLQQYLPKADIGPRAHSAKWLGSAAKVEDGTSKLFRSFLWRIVSDFLKYAALVVPGKETLVSLRFLHGIHSVISAMDYDRRDADLGQGCQLRLDGRVARIACGITNAMTVGVDHYIHEIGVVERFGGSTIRLLIESPVRRPELP